MNVKLRQATIDDALVLAEMNKHLIEDEGSRNPMTAAQLEDRMRQWLAGEWQGIMVQLSGQIVGYMLFRIRVDEYDLDQVVVIVRQFFIGREQRGNGLGRQAFQMAAQQFFPAGATLTLDVLESNPGGRRFWEQLGFSPYSTTMRR